MANEVAAVSTAFQTEASKAVAELPQVPKADCDGAYALHHRAVKKLGELVTYYVARLPYHAWIPQLLALGVQLQERSEFAAASELCYQRVTSLQLPGMAATEKMTPTSKLSWHTEALYGTHFCQASLRLSSDPQIAHETTLLGSLQGLFSLRAACMQAAAVEELYWLVHNGTILIYKLAHQLATAGFSLEALPYFIFCAKAMESSIALSNASFLPWRVQLYTAAAQCYSSLLHHARKDPTTGPGGSSNSTTQLAAALQQAQLFLSCGIQQVDHLMHLQTLDPVPPPPELLCSYQAAKAQLVAAKLATEGAPTPAPAAAGTAPAAAATPPAAAAASSSSSLQDVVKALPADQDKLAVLIRMLEASGCLLQPLHQQQSVPGHLQAAVEAVKALVSKLLPAEWMRSPGGSEGEPGQQQELLRVLDSALPLQQHQALIMTAYSLSQGDLFQQLQAAGIKRIALHKAVDAVHPRPATSSAAISCFSGVLSLYSAFEVIRNNPKDGVQALSSEVQQHSPAVAAQLPALVASAAHLLQQAAAQDIQTVASGSDAAAADVCHVLLGLHAAFEATDCKDGVLRVATALRLGLLLEEQGRVMQALNIAEQGICAVQAAREAAMRLHGGAGDEHVCWISGSKTQPSAETALLLQGMSPTEQELACLHTDLLMLQYRLQLAEGVRQVQAKAAEHQQKLRQAAAKRDAQSDIFGTRTMKEKRLDDTRVQKAGEVASIPTARERELLSACQKNSYQQALVLMSSATFQSDPSKQASLLEAAAQALVEAAQAEAALLAAMQQPLGSEHVRKEVPWQPKVLFRGTNSVSTTHFPLQLKAAGQAAQYAVYCKPTGAGVGLSINKTAMELPGTGKMVPLQNQVTIEGLKTNETYIFGLAAYTADGKLLGDLGTSTPPILAALPLPLFYCWAHLLLVAIRLGQWSAAQKAAALLFPHFLDQQPLRPVWEQHPMDSLQLKQLEAAVAALPLLRLFVQGLYAYACREQQAIGSNDGKLAYSRSTKTVLVELRESALPGQLAVFRNCKRVLIGMQICHLLSDDRLLQEGAIWAYHLLTPLLGQKDAAHLLQQALSYIHLSLKSCKAVAAPKQHGQAGTQQLAARIAAAASYHMLRVYAPWHEQLLWGGPAAVLGARIGQQLLPAVQAGKLDLDVFADAREAPAVAGNAASAGRQSGSGGAAGAAAAGAATVSVVAKRAGFQGDELQAAQVAALMNPNASTWGATGLAERMKGGQTDLAATALPLLSNLTGKALLTECWPLLHTDTAKQSRQWLPLVVMVAEAALLQGGREVAAGAVAAPSQQPATAAGGAAAGLTSLADVYSAVKEYVRLAARVPQLKGWEKWQLSSALVEVQGVGFGEKGLVNAPPAPDVAALGPEEQQQALADWEIHKQQLLETERQRLAATLLLQRRLPVLVRRKQYIAATRVQLASWMPWLARLETLMSTAAAEVAVQQQQQLQQQQQQLQQQQHSLGAASPRAPGSPRTSVKTPRTSVKSAPVDAGKLPAQSPADIAANALSHTGRAAVLSCRATLQWHELMHSLQHLWNTGQTLLQSHEQLTSPKAPCTWAVSLLPLPKVPALGLEGLPRSAAPISGSASTVAGAGAAAGKGKGAASEKKGAAGKAAKGAAAAAEPQPPARHVLQSQKVGTRPHQALRAVLEALLTAVEQLKTGNSCWYPAVVPLQEQPNSAATTASKATSSQPHAAASPSAMGHSAELAAAGAPDAGTHPAEGSMTAAGGGAAAAAALHATRPGSTCTGGKVDTGAAGEGASAFSLGSDAHKVEWCRDSALDMQWLGQLVVLLLRGLVRAEQWHQSLALGQKWLAVTEGVAAEPLLQLLLQVAPHVAGGQAVPALTAALKALMRDKNTAQQALDKVRSLVQDRLAELPLLHQGFTGSKAGKRSPRGRPASLAANLSIKRSQSGISGDARTVVSGVGTGVAATARSSHQPDYLKLPGEYELVVASLRKKGEKGLLVMALNELGDVHAHFGNWAAATTAWSDALDTLLGPYQVLTCWRQQLGVKPWAALLQVYGVHGLLLAGGTLLGKLSRYAYHEDRGMCLEAARLSAYLLPAVFSCDIVHPQRELEFALYTPVELWPGKNLFSDAYRCNVPDLLAGVEALATNLVQQGFHLEALPVLALWDHLASSVARQLLPTLLSRFTRVNALCGLGLVSEAAAVIIGLMWGRNLPNSMLPGTLQLLGAKQEHMPVFHAGLWPGHPKNKAAVAEVASGAVAQAVADLYGPWATGKLVQARAAWLAAVGGVRNCWQGCLPPGGVAVPAAAAAAAGDAGAGGAAAAAATTTEKAATPAAGKAGGNEGKNAAGKGAKGPAAAAIASEGQVPGVLQILEPIEEKLLDTAAALLQGGVNSCRSSLGLPPMAWPEEQASPGGKGGKGSKGGKGGSDAPAPKPAAATATPNISTSNAAVNKEPGDRDETHCLLHAQQVQLLVEELLQLAEVEALRWQPLRALGYCVDALQLGRDCGDLASGLAGGNEDLARFGIGALLWIKGQIQLCELLLELQHYGACLAQVEAAQQMCQGVSDQLSFTVLMGVKAAALAAQGDVAGALNTYRAARSRLVLLGVKDARMFHLLKHYSSMCEQLSLSADAEGLAAAALDVAQDLAAKQGLKERLGNPLHYSLYCSSTPMLLKALVPVAGYHLRRRRLRQAEAHFRAAKQLLAVSRCLPSEEAEVLLELARVLRVQVALKEPVPASASSGTSLGGLASWLMPPAVTSSGELEHAATRNASGGGQPPAAALTPQAVHAPATAGGIGSMAGSCDQRLTEAMECLKRALQLLTTDTSCCPDLLQACLLESAHVTSATSSTSPPPAAAAAAGEAGGGATGTAASVGASVTRSYPAATVVAGRLAVLLQTARAAVVKYEALVRSPQEALLLPATGSSSSSGQVLVGLLPPWVVEWVTQQESLSQQQQRAREAIAAAAANSGGLFGGETNTGSNSTDKQAINSSSSSSSSSTTMTRTKAATAARAGGGGGQEQPQQLQLSDALIGRLVVQKYFGLVKSAVGGLSRGGASSKDSQKLLLLHQALKKAWPQLEGENGKFEVPELPVSVGVKPPPTGTIITQWHQPPLCWQVPSSWTCDGSLGAAALHKADAKPITQDQILALRPTLGYISLLYVLHVPAVGGAQLLSGELVMPLGRVMSLRGKIQLMRARLENPAAPGALFGAPAPSEAELAAAKHQLDCTLGCIPEDDLPPVPSTLPAHAIAAAARRASQPGDAGAGNAPGGTATANVSGSGTVKRGTGVGAKTAAGAGGGKGATIGKGGSRKSLGGGGGLVGPDAGGEVEVGDAEPQPVDWRSVQTWARLEGLLDVQAGGEVVDGSLAAYLGQLLASQSQQQRPQGKAWK